MAADSKARLRDEAERLMIQGKIPQAIDQFLKIVKNDPQDVMTLNTVGDLYLTIGYTEKAHNCFIKVAEKYVSNNFFLKAIAVYKKILRTDPFNVQINTTIASLYARQGLNIEACSQYFNLIKIYEQAGSTEEIIDIYRKIVELDPENVAVQQKLADIFLADGENDKAGECLISAARGLVKTAEYASAMKCFEKALQVNPLDTNGLEGFMECCLKTDNIPRILNQLKESLKSDPHNLNIKEMLGQVHLAENNPEAASDILKTVVDADESRYECFIPVAKAFIDLEKFDEASECLDPIIPILITRRRTDLAIKHYKQVLEHNAEHTPTLKKLASVLSAAGDMPNYLEVLDKIVEQCIDREDRIAALEYLEKILQADPESKKHLDLHKVVFIETHPDEPYIPPAVPAEATIKTGPVPEPQEEPDADFGTPETIVEADLLINYGMTEKALSLLQHLETRDPYDKRIRTRLLSLFKEKNRSTEAAEQCLLLAALHRKSKDEDSVEKYVSEAKKLDPELVDHEQDIETFARLRGIVTQTSSDGNQLGPDPEIDLSGDLLDIFFTDDQSRIAGDASDLETIPDEIPQELAAPAPTQSIEEKLQEVDFYIRLGFKDEAQKKLNEIAKINPDNPDLPSRYEKLNEMEASGEEGPEVAASPEDQGDEQIAEDAFAESAEDINIFQDMDIDAALENFTENLGQRDDTSAIKIPEENGASPEITPEDNMTGSQSRQDAAPEHGTSKIAVPEQQDATIESNTSNGTDIAGESVSEERIPQTQPLQEDAPATESPDFAVNDMFSDLLEEVSLLSDQEIKKENFEDHFSLGTAYRDMDLIEEAIKEFQTAIRITESTNDSKRLVQCCGMLSTCFLKKSMPRSALRWCQTGLSVKDITSQEAMALRYDMGIAHSMEGNQELALKYLDQIFSADPGYRDVAQKIDEIKNNGRIKRTLSPGME